MAWKAAATVESHVTIQTHHSLSLNFSRHVLKPPDKYPDRKVYMGGKSEPRVESGVTNHDDLQDWAWTLPAYLSIS